MINKLFMYTKVGLPSINAYQRGLAAKPINFGCLISIQVLSRPVCYYISSDFGSYDDCNF